jgi:hypothetical protein
MSAHAPAHALPARCLICAASLVAITADWRFVDDVVMKVGVQLWLMP